MQILKTILDFFFGGAPKRISILHPTYNEYRTAITYDGRTAKFSDGITVDIPEDATIVAHSEKMEPDPKKIRIHND